MVVVRVVGAELPVVSRARISAPAHERCICIRDVSGIRRKINAMDEGTDEMAVGQHVNVDVDIGDRRWWWWWRVAATASRGTASAAGEEQNQEERRDTDSQGPYARRSHG